MITDRLSALFKWCRNKLKNDVLPAVADNWYALRHHNGSVCSCFSKGRNTDDDEEEGDEEQENEASLEYRTKVPIKWNQRDVVSFICHEVTMGDVKEFRICRLCKERRHQHYSNLANLGFDPVSVRKLRKKIGSLGHDNSAEERVAELKRFLHSQDLGHLSSRLITELGIFDADELPILMNDKKWVKSIVLSVADEIKLKSAVRAYAQSNAVSKTSSDIKFLGKRKSITLRPLEPVSKDISRDARRSLYKTVTETGLDRLDNRTAARPEYLQSIKSHASLGKRKPALVVPTSVKWNADTVFTEGNPSVLSVFV